MTEQNLHIVVYYRDGDGSVDAIYRELDDLDVPYERIEISSQPHDDNRTALRGRGRFASVSNRLH